MKKMLLAPIVLSLVTSGCAGVLQDFGNMFKPVTKKPVISAEAAARRKHLQIHVDCRTPEFTAVECAGPADVLKEAGYTVNVERPPTTASR